MRVVKRESFLQIAAGVLSLTVSSEAKRSAGNDVDWNKVAYDLGDVNWSSVFATPTPTPSATPTPTPSAAAEAKPTTTAEVKAAEATIVKATEAETSTSTSEKASSTSSAEAAATSSSTIDDISDDIGDAIGDLVSDFMHGVETIASKLGCKVGKNDQSNNGGIWIGNDSKWKAEFTNEHDDDAVLYCWKADGYSGMIIKDNTPDISVGIKSGQSVEISFAENVPAACAPVFADTKLAMFGGVDNTWWEVTFGQYGAFDVSRNVNMKGNTINSKGSKCTSDMETCVFKCKDSSLASCETGYDLYNCNAAGGGGGGYDVVMQGTGGGCNMASEGETVKVAFS
jgi:hypothetical protein